MGSIFGGGSKSKSTNESYNKAYGDVSAATVPYLGAIGAGTNAMQNLLGGNMDGFKRFAEGLGYATDLSQGQQAIAANALSRGLGDSGATLKSLAEFGAQLNNSYLDKYLAAATGTGEMGINLGNLLTNAGQYSQGTSTQKSSGGFGSMIGAGIGAIAASDRRLKKNIFKIGELKNGLNLYQFRYINNDGPFVGVMAQEVKELMPEALGPEVNGYMTVNYEVIKDGAL